VYWNVPPMVTLVPYGTSVIIKIDTVGSVLGDQ
jgi:hypothetical protein